MSGVPMNMEEWQRRMRAEKEAERQQKMQSAEILQGYRRGSLEEEHKKLKAMREAERQRQIDAQQRLHGYRGGEDNLSVPKKTERPQQQQHPLPPSVQREADPLGQIAPGSVSAKAAHLLATLSPPTDETETVGSRIGATTNGNSNIMDSVAPPAVDPAPAQVVQQQPATSAMDNTAPAAEPKMDPSSTEPIVAPAAAPSPPTETEQMASSNPFEATMAPAEPSMAPPPAEPMVAPPAPEAMASDPFEMVMAPPPAEPMTAPPAAETMASDQFEMAMAPPPAEPMMAQPVAPAEPIVAPPPPPAETMDSAPAAGAESMMMMMMPPPQQPPAAPAEVRRDIMVSFGVLTDSVNPDLAAYMSAMEQIISSSSVPGISFKPDCAPYVTNQQWDGAFVDPAGRTHVRRVLVTVAVPIFFSSDYPAHQAEQSTIEQLRSAIDSGRILQLVQQQQQLF